MDDDVRPPVDHAEQPVTVFAIVPPAILHDDSIRIEEDADGMGEIETTTHETSIALGIVLLELHLGCIGQ